MRVCTTQRCEREQDIQIAQWKSWNAINTNITISKHTWALLGQRESLPEDHRCSCCKFQCKTQRHCSCYPHPLHQPYMPLLGWSCQQTLGLVACKTNAINLKIKGLVILGTSFSFITRNNLVVGVFGTVVWLSRFWRSRSASTWFWTSMPFLSSGLKTW